MTETLRLHSGFLLKGVHPKGTCYLENCCIHKPSDHPLRDAPMDWWGDFRHMVRVCEHNFRHPDPDDLDFKMATGDWITVEAICSVHLMKENCDGCCQTEHERENREPADG